MAVVRRKFRYIVDQLNPIFERDNERFPAFAALGFLAFVLNGHAVLVPTVFARGRVFYALGLGVAHRKVVDS